MQHFVPHFTSKTSAPRAFEGWGEQLPRFCSDKPDLAYFLAVHDIVT